MSNQYKFLIESPKKKLNYRIDCIEHVWPNADKILVCYRYRQLLYYCICDKGMGNFLDLINGIYHKWMYVEKKV